MKFTDFQNEFSTRSFFEEHKINHATWLRFCFIERQLLWSRKFTASMAREAFDISTNMMHLEVKRYQEIYFEITGKEAFKKYDPKLKYHRPEEEFSPIFLNDETFHWKYIEDYEDVDTSLASEMPMLTRRHSLKNLAIVLSAIENKRTLQTVVASMTSPKGRARIITPIGVACVHNRVHIRAYCWDNLDYRDFLVGRLIGAPKIIYPNSVTELNGNTNPFDQFAGIPQSEDTDWNEHISLKLIPNPKLSNDQRALIAADYNLGTLNNLLEINLRKSLVQYFLIDNRLPSNQIEFDAAKKKPNVWPVLAFVAETDEPAHNYGFQ